MAADRDAATLRDSQDVDVNYYVLVPFTTAETAEWATGYIGISFDCHVIRAAFVNQDAPVISEVKSDA